MCPQDCNAPLHPAALRGLQLFNAGQYFEAHEALELAWRAESGPIRGLYQGILQVAVTYYHIQRGNQAGALKLAERCQPKLAAWPAQCRGVNVAQLRQDLADALLDLQRPNPPARMRFKPVQFTQK